MAKRQRNRLVATDADGTTHYIREEIEETAPAKTAEEAKAEEPKVEFDAWYASRSSVIPPIHKKEILKADFQGRKVSMVATMAEFDEALKKYGVRLV